MKMKNKHSKMKRIRYQELKMQDYLVSKELTKEEKLTLMRWRVHMERFGENYRGRRDIVDCPL